jgi:hypothetical protein
MGRRQRDPKLEQLWRQRLARWRASGQSVRAFCAAEGIPESAWYFWRRELKRRSTTPDKRRPKSPAFVPVTVVAAATGVVEVRCPSGHVVTLPAGNAVLRRLFAALAVSEPC